MEKEQNNKIKWLHLRLSVEEYNKIHRQFSKTTCRKLSEYARNKLLEKHLTTYYRNQSLDDFMTEMIRLRTDLNAIGNNFNQAVKRLNSMPQNGNAQGWMIAYERDKNRVMQHIEDIKDHIQKIAEQWLQNSTPTPR